MKLDNIITLLGVLNEGGLSTEILSLTLSFLTTCRMNIAIPCVKKEIDENEK